MILSTITAFVYLMAWQGVFIIIWRRCKAFGPQSNVFAVWANAAVGAEAAHRLMQPFFHVRLNFDDALLAGVIFAFLYVRQPAPKCPVHAAIRH